MHVPMRVCSTIYPKPVATLDDLWFYQGYTCALVITVWQEMLRTGKCESLKMKRTQPSFTYLWCEWGRRLKHFELLIIRYCVQMIDVTI